VLHRFPDDFARLPEVARILARGLADIAGGGFLIGVCGDPGFDVVDWVAQAVRCELKDRRGSAGCVGRIDETTVLALL
jgi:hypothetical protein